MKYVYMLLAAILIMAWGVRANAENMTIHNGSKVAFDYTLTVDGKVLDTSQKRGPMEYTQGDGRLIPGLTRQLEGLRAGDEKMVEVKPEEGYGTVNPAAFKSVPLSALPAGVTPTVGMTFQTKDKNGQAMITRISEVKKDSVIMDFNHPLAGKTLLFTIKIVSVK